MMKKLILIFTFLIFPFIVSAEQFPSFPMAFWGTIKLNNQSLPIGSTLSAYCNNEVIGSVSITEDGIYGYEQSTKKRLSVKNCATKIIFKYILANTESPLTGEEEISYPNFVEAETIHKDINFVSNKTSPNINTGIAIINNETPRVVITNPNQAVTTTISSGTINPQIDVSSFISGGAGVLPAITINSANANNVSVVIPASTTVISADTTWNGVISAPTITTVTVPNTSTETMTMNTAIEVGFTGAKLSFNKAVRILLSGQAGKRAGYMRTGIPFTEITATCSDDTQATNNLLAADTECKINVGNDLVIWTKHFTSFASFTATSVVTTPTNTIASSGGGGGGGSGSSSSSILTNPTTILLGDFNNDKKIDKYDFALLMSNWGKTLTNVCDLNNDKKVDKYDFSLLMSKWS